MYRLFLFLITTSAVLMSGLIISAHAEMKIIESNVPQQYPVGKVIPNDFRIELPPGGLVRVLRLPSNETAVFENPKPIREEGGTRGLHKKVTPE
jgi:hypothetical protein